MDNTQEYIFIVSAPEADLILEALMELPMKKVADLFFKLRKQAADVQQDAVTEAK